MPPIRTEQCPKNIHKGHEVMALLRRKAVRCLIFMDDPLLLSSTKQELFQILQKTMTLLSLLGFQNQQGKIRLDSNTEDPVFGLYGGLQNNDAEFAGGENQEIDSGLQAGSEAVLIVNSDNRKIDQEGCQQPHKQSFQPLCTIGPSRDSRMQPPGGQMSQQDKERGCYNSANCTFVDSTDLVTISVGGTGRLSNPSASEQRRGNMPHLKCMEQRHECSLSISMGSLGALVSVKERIPMHVMSNSLSIS